MTRTAQCCCGALRAEANAEPQIVALCHCVECQRRTGAPFGVAAFFDRSAVRVSGANTTFVRRSDVGRKLEFHFCPECGSTVWWEPEFYPDKIAIAVGAFADADFPPPLRAVFAQSCHRWVLLPPGTPSHVAGRDSALID